MILSAHLFVGYDEKDFEAVSRTGSKRLVNERGACRIASMTERRGRESTQYMTPRTPRQWPSKVDTREDVPRSAIVCEFVREKCLQLSEQEWHSGGAEIDVDPRVHQMHESTDI